MFLHNFGGLCSVVNIAKIKKTSFNELADAISLFNSREKYPVGKMSVIQIMFQVSSNTSKPLKDRTKEFKEETNPEMISFLESFGLVVRVSTKTVLYMSASGRCFNEHYMSLKKAYKNARS